MLASRTQARIARVRPGTPNEPPPPNVTAFRSPSVLAQYLLPKQAITSLAGRFAGARAGGVTHAAIRRFVARYGVDMSEAADPRMEAYATFNDFFTRALRPGARPLAGAGWLCPVDGRISQFGRVEDGTIFQAKGHRFGAAALLGGDDAYAAQFRDGHFATIYLSPRDYHRVHMPCDGTLRRMDHVPGELFSVNPTTAAAVPALFARNERVVCRFDTARGPLALVLVGATIVGSMATVWHGLVNPPRPGRPREWRYDDRVTELARGEEMGRFLLGSTVVLLMPEGAITFAPDWSPGRPVRMGEAMGD
jgi:phosphatidylserine decarboxylase